MLEPVTVTSGGFSVRNRYFQLFFLSESLVCFVLVGRDQDHELSCVKMRKKAEIEKMTWIYVIACNSNREEWRVLIFRAANFGLFFSTYSQYIEKFDIQSRDYYSFLGGKRLHIFKGIYIIIPLSNYSVLNIKKLRCCILISENQRVLHETRKMYACGLSIW